ncbi:hypothetical protein QJS04_geneDACA002844 [Acorus gramineus]|uniref:Uncharacterized protein n=1 Tax=Acorus gramineus TaxID=55184 RepID=A0AAV9BY05_ACOGR|nr:hypothetical protein QJS04_geneDACA002844 [Acorus gramineus]
MPGIIMDGVDENTGIRGLDPATIKDNSSVNRSPRSPLSSRSLRSVSPQQPEGNCIDTSIDKLYDNVCEMQSSIGGSPSRQSYGSEGEESRIDSELRHLVGGEVEAVEILQEEEKVEGEEDSVKNFMTSKEKSGNSKSMSSSSKLKMASKLQLESDASVKSSPNRKLTEKKLSPGGVVRQKKQRNSVMGDAKAAQNGSEDPSEAGLDNPDLGPFLLKQARGLISDNPLRALELATRAAKSFERCSDGKPSLELVMSLHVTAAIHCSLGQYSQAIPILERSLGIPVLELGQDHALAKFSGYMQLGDTYGTLGQLKNSIESYTMGLDIQKQSLGEMDPRVGETCRFLAEAHFQALRFEEAEKMCQMALDIHRNNGEAASLEEAADRRLMGLIYDTKGDHEAALEHLVLASMAMAANGQEAEVASVDCSIGDTYLSLARYDEAVFAYQKALTVLKTTKGENHPTIASVFVRLADLYNKTGKLRDSKSYCENALRIYEKPVKGTPAEEIATGFTEISAIYESMNEHEQALKLLQKALKIYDNAPGQQSTIAGIEAQMGVMYYMLGSYAESYASFSSAVTKLRASGEKKSAFFGIALNQMGLACVQRYAINEAADLFEEARSILEQEYGPYHPDTLGVYSNLAGTYDAMGRLDDAIEILEYVVGMREDKLGTANPDVDDEKRRLAELLKEAGRVRTRKARSLENLLDANPCAVRNNESVAL